MSFIYEQIKYLSNIFSWNVYLMFENNIENINSTIVMYM